MPSGVSHILGWTGQGPCRPFSLLRCPLLSRPQMPEVTLLSVPFYRWRHGGTRRAGQLSKVTWLMRNRIGWWTRPVWADGQGDSVLGARPHPAVLGGVTGPEETTPIGHVAQRLLEACHEVGSPHPLPLLRECAKAGGLSSRPLMAQARSRSRPSSWEMR